MESKESKEEGRKWEGNFKAEKGRKQFYGTSTDCTEIYQREGERGNIVEDEYDHDPHCTDSFSQHRLSLTAWTVSHSMNSLSQHRLSLTAETVSHSIDCLSQHGLCLTAWTVSHSIDCLSEYRLSLTA
jgi:hypothetical protein